MTDKQAPPERVIEDEHALWDAAYVLGSLSCADRREYEAHFNTCVGCRLAVSELCGLPGLLHRLTLQDVAALDEAAAHGGRARAAIDAHMLNELVAQASRRRRRARMVTWMVAAAAAVVVVIGVVLACQANLAPTSVSRQADATAVMTTPSSTDRHTALS
jgi:anti-sigma factor RsiW